MTRPKQGAISRRKMLFGALRGFGAAADVPETRKDAPAEQVDTLHQANRAFGRGDFTAAIQLYREVVRNDANNTEVRSRLGRCLYAVGKFIQARVEFERVLRILGEDNQASLYLGLCLLRTGKTAKAVRAWKAYFDPHDILVQREVNLQVGLLETADDALESVDPGAMADAVEAAIDRSAAGGGHDEYEEA